MVACVRRPIIKVDFKLDLIRTLADANLFMAPICKFRLLFGYVAVRVTSFAWSLFSLMLRSKAVQLYDKLIRVVCLERQ